MKTRPTKSGDIPALKLVLDGTELFPSDMLSEMASGFLSDEDSEDVWLTCESDSTAIGFCYAAPEQLTEGTWNMLAIAVRPSNQVMSRGMVYERRPSERSEADQAATAGSLTVGLSVMRASVSRLM